MGAFLHNPGCNCCEEETLCDQMADLGTVYTQAEMVLAGIGNSLCSNCAPLNGTYIGTVLSNTATQITYQHTLASPVLLSPCSGASSITVTRVLLIINCTTGGITMLPTDASLNFVVQWGATFTPGGDFPISDTLTPNSNVRCTTSTNGSYELLP